MVPFETHRGVRGVDRSHSVPPVVRVHVLEVAPAGYDNMLVHVLEVAPAAYDNILVH
jgi:hypothetical protein